MKSVTINMKQTLHIWQKMAHYVRPKHVEELTIKYIIQCINLELILRQYNVVASNIRSFKLKKAFSF